MVSVGVVVMASMVPCLRQNAKTWLRSLLELIVMELRQLAYVVAVAEESSFTRAAEREHVAQPGVSAQVRRLEAELGQPLFDRGAGSVSLTAAGEAVLPFARAALAGLARGRVAIGVVPSVGARLADALAGFHAEHPGVEITLEERLSAELLER